MAIPPYIHLIQNVRSSPLQMFLKIKINNPHIQRTLNPKLDKPADITSNKSKKSFKQRHKRYPT